MRREVVPPGTVAARREALHGEGLLRGIGVAAGPDALVQVLGVVAALDVQGVGARELGGRAVRPGTASLGKDVGGPVGGRIKRAVRTVGRPGSGLIGPGDPRIAGKLGSGRTGHGVLRAAVLPATVARGTGEGARVTPTAMTVGQQGSGRIGLGGLRMAGDRGIGQEASAGTQARLREAAGQRMGVLWDGRTTGAPGRRIVALRGHDGGPRGIRAG
jgi:hypothetical protein